jgi:hypothetical protein
MKIYNENEVNEIIENNEWVVTTCNNEPYYGVHTLQIQLDEDTDYIGEFVGNETIGYVFYFYTKNETNLNNEAKTFLERNGFFTDNLWSVADVQGVFNCTDEQALEILKKALTNEATMEQIQLSIREFGEMAGYEEIEEEIYP